MTVRNVRKQLLGMEDILQGVGTQEQTRNSQAFVIGMIDAPYAVNTTAELTALNTSVYKRGRIYSSTTVFTDYIYDATATAGIAPDIGTGFWVVSLAQQAITSALEFDTLAAASAGLLINGNTIALAIDNIIHIAERTATKGGGAYWKCEDASTIPSPNGYDEVGISATIVLTLIIRGPMSTAQYGALHDNATDDTGAVAQALSATKAANVPVVSSTGIAKIDSEIGLAINGGMHIIWAAGSSWEAITSASSTTDVATMTGQNNILERPTITGDKTSHTGAPSDTCYGLIVDSTSGTNTIIQPVIQRAWGHGLYLKNVGTLFISDPYVLSNDGSGIVIENVQDILSVTGTARVTGNAKKGVSVLPLTSGDELVNIAFDVLLTGSNDEAGFDFDIGVYPNTGIDQRISITVNKHIDERSFNGWHSAQCPLGLTEVIDGLVYIGSADYSLSDNQGVYHEDYSGANTPKVVFNLLRVIDANNLGSSSDSEANSVAIYRTTAMETTAMGNLQINSAFLDDTRSVPKVLFGLYVKQDSGSADVENVDITLDSLIGTPSVATNAHMAIAGARIKDPNNLLVQDLTGNISVLEGAISLFTSTDAVKRNVTLAAGITDNGNLDMEFEVMTGSGGIRVIPTSTTILPSSTVAGKYMESTEVGARLVIRQDLANSNWNIISEIGTWTVEP